MAMSLRLPTGLAIREATSIPGDGIRLGTIHYIILGTIPGSMIPIIIGDMDGTIRSTIHGIRLTTTVLGITTAATTMEAEQDILATTAQEPPTTDASVAREQRALLADAPVTSLREPLAAVAA